MRAYEAYNRLQAIREEIDVKLGDTKMKWKKGQREAISGLRGNGDPDGGDFLYGSVTESSLEKETIVSLQEKLLFILAVLQSAEAAPTTQALDAVTSLVQRRGISRRRRRRLRRRRACARCIRTTQVAP